MAIECEKTAASVHANSYSIVAVVAGLVAAVAIFAVLLFVFYDGENNIRSSSAALTEAIKTSGQVSSKH